MSQQQAIKTLFEACEPRSDVLEGSLAEEEFAADLGDVVYGDGDSIYDDPGDFFEKTYPTDGLEKLLGNLMGQVIDGSGSSVIDLDTTFGGGKTHNLIAAYHFLTAPATIDQPERFIDIEKFDSYRTARDDKSVSVAAFVGTDVDALDASMSSEGLNSTSTIWGELAYRLEGKDGYDRIREYDERRIAPGKSSFGEVLDDDTHYVVLLDELAEYLAGAQRVDASAEGDDEGVDDLADSTLVFFKSLLQYATTNDNLSVLYTIADTAFTEKAEEVRAAVDELEAIGKRKEWSITPTDDDEIAPVIGYRLFNEIDETAAAQVAEAYDKQLFTDPEFAVPANVTDGEYDEEISSSYPFHPSTIDVLTQKVDSLANFQKTRGALRLLSRAVYHLWNNRPDHYERHLIRPYDLTLANAEIRSEAQDLFEAVNLEAARRNDVWHKDETAHAQVEDQKRARDGLPRLGSHLATTIFWHSLSFSTDDTERGITQGALNVAVAHPGVRLDKFHDSLDNLTYEGGLNTDTACYYLHTDNNVYRFTSEATVSQILAEEREKVNDGDIHDEIEERVSGLKTGGGFEVCTPEGPYDLPDNDGKPKLAVMHHNSVTVGTEDTPPQKLTELHQYRDDGGEPRVYKNNALFIVADSEKRQDALDTVRKLVARQNVIDKDEYQEVISPEQEEEIKQLKSKLLVNTAIKQIYRHLYYPTDDGLAHIFLKDVDVTDHSSFEQIVRDAFDESGDPIALEADDGGRAPFYIEPRFFSATIELDTEEFVRRFRKNTEVPLLLSLDPIKDTIVKCCQEGEFGYIDSNGTGYYNTASAADADVALPDSDAYENLNDAEMLSRYDVEISEEARLYADIEAFLEQEGEQKTCANCGDPATSRYCDDCATCDQPGCSTRLPEHEVGVNDLCEAHREGPPTCAAEGCNTEISGGPAFCSKHQTATGVRANDKPMGVLRALTELRDQLRGETFENGAPVLDDLDITFTGNNAWDDAYDFVDYLDNPFADVEGTDEFDYRYIDRGDVEVECTASGDVEDMPSSAPLSQNGGEQQISLSTTVEPDAIVGDTSLLDTLIGSLEDGSVARGTVIVEAEVHNVPEGGI
ncbi:ATP-binding protein [Halobacterium salinarum]|uniref:ATP-binding protein n=1 Tax=Halobacterium salinarum TaxID=2242 RepID=UPI0025578638|nr:DUF499 domain-containing protein [Halobacterium salinarum]MDL0145562.1 DUF499 domain-containing protein [Halobacterium salinarum]